ncbi:MAG: alpha-L-rhamnosidase C-terminal domain-containing protein [Mangrovibacterium sp.]
MRGFTGRWAGINPDENSPGFKEIILKPEVVGNLTWVRASYDSPYGEIGSAWKTENDSMVMDITIPVNTTACVYISCEHPETIWESGMPVSRSGDIKVEKTENGKAILKVGSGKYHFTMPFSQIKD